MWRVLHIRCVRRSRRAAQGRSLRGRRHRGGFLTAPGGVSLQVADGPQAFRDSCPTVVTGRASGSLKCVQIYALTPVRDSEISQSRLASAKLDARGLRPTRVGRPLSSKGPPGPT